MGKEKLRNLWFIHHGEERSDETISSLSA